MIAWLDGDKLALDAVLAEAMADPTGVPGLPFSLTAFAAVLGERAAPDIRDQLQASLLSQGDGSAGDVTNI